MVWERILGSMWTDIVLTGVYTIASAEAKSL